MDAKRALHELIDQRRQLSAEIERINQRIRALGFDIDAHLKQTPMQQQQQPLPFPSDDDDDQASAPPPS